jgi:hypothetical protein
VDAALLQWWRGEDVLRATSSSGGVLSKDGGSGGVGGGGGGGGALPATDGQVGGVEVPQDDVFGVFVRTRVQRTEEWSCRAAHTREWDYLIGVRDICACLAVLDAAGLGGGNDFPDVVSLSGPNVGMGFAAVWSAGFPHALGTPPTTRRILVLLGSEQKAGPSNPVKLNNTSMNTFGLDSSCEGGVDAVNHVVTKITSELADGKEGGVLLVLDLLARGGDDKVITKLLVRFHNTL